MTPPAGMDKDAVKVASRQVFLTQGALESAKFLAQTLFADRTDWGGNPFYGHLQRVADGIKTGGDVGFRHRLETIAYLHDLLEDIDGWTEQDLADIGFDDFIIAGVVALTKSGAGAPYFDEMVRVGLTPQAIPVKKSDLTDNGNLLRLPALPSPDDFDRTRKYYLSYYYLSDIEAAQVTPGTPFAIWMAAQPPGRQDWELLRQHCALAAPIPGPGKTASAPPPFTP